MYRASEAEKHCNIYTLNTSTSLCQQNRI